MSGCGQMRPCAVQEGCNIASLQRGDEVRIQVGYGQPTSDQIRTDVIADVQGESALTVAGVMLMCTDGAGVLLTGERHEVELSPEALRIMGERGTLGAGTSPS